MVGLFPRFSVGKAGHRRSQSALVEGEVVPPISDVATVAAATAAPTTAHGIEVAVEFKPVEHPIEPLDNDQPIQCPLPEPSILNDGRIWKERVSASVRRRADLPVMQDGGTLQSQSESEATVGTKPRPTSNLESGSMAALQYLESLRNEHPELADWYSSLADLYQKKLWHQLTLKLEQFVALTVFQVSLSFFWFRITSLLGTRVEWLYHILQAFNSGDLARYQELCHVHNAALRAQPALVENEKKLSEKINILCLMEIIFSRPSEDRTIPLKVIAERTKLSIEDVEHLLMKSLSVHLIEGTIDQVEGTVHVSWVQPRVLGIPQIKSLRDRLDNWVGKVQTAWLSIEAETPDLVAA
ncbi:hypothetical protein GOBAR_DD21669 [Gossypium barbadense]|nr:hypothetical protein GOBAR_DD21669 [Gossypium barbadense]